MIRYGLLHNHTYNSCRDCCMSEIELVKRAKELGAPAVAISDHGVMTGIVPFMEACKAEKIKPVIGVEAYVEESDEGRKHLCLYAKDEIGFRAISRAVTASNERGKTVGKIYYPRMNKDILTQCFGSGSEGHGHVIATSACVSGVLCGVLFQNEKYEKKMGSLKGKQKELIPPDDAEYLKETATFENAKAELKMMSSRITELKRLSSRPTLALERKAERAKDEATLKSVLEELEKAKQTKAEAVTGLVGMQKEKELLESRVRNLKAMVTEKAKDVAKWQRIEDQISEIKKLMIPEHELESQMIEQAVAYQFIFGDDLYAEVQYHGMAEEKKAMLKLLGVADKLNIPLVVTNDAHISTNSADNIKSRAIMRTTMFDSWTEPTESEKEMYIKEDEELIDKISEIIPKEKAIEAFENVGKIIEQCNFKLVKENHYPKFVAPDGSTAEEYLSKMARAGIKVRYGDTWTGEHEKRLQHELSVICKMGYADYLCIVQDYLSYARAAGKLNLYTDEGRAMAKTFDTAKIEEATKDIAGEAVGPGRGSAAGSLVCYLTGITAIDPIRYGLLFERFLNPERVSMPDIDCDLSSEVRGYVIDYMKIKYGSVSGIYTRGKLTGKAAIRAAARVYGIRAKGDSTYYIKLSNEIASKAVDYSESEINVDLKAISDRIEADFSDNKVALEIYKDAKLIENVVDQTGVHASGIIVADGEISNYVPLMYKEKNDMMVTQVDMVEAESEFGLLKFDFLGLKNLSIITNTLKQIQERTEKKINMDDVPFEQEVFSEIFAKAKTNSVFQFESRGMKQMLKDFKPNCIDDLVLLVAMYRPGPLQYLDNVIKVKQGVKPLTYLTPELEPILKETYGSITYQEQVQQIFRDLAGYSLGQADLVRRAMSKKKERVLLAERDAFVHGDSARNISGCAARGISVEVASKLFDEMTEFAKYAFNKSHAACYAIVAYQTAYLKYHYPKEFIASCFKYSEFEKFSNLIADLKEANICVRIPDVNLSQLDFALIGDEVRYGLGCIKGLGASARVVLEERKKGLYVSVGDFVSRVLPSKDILESFIASGAFDSLTPNRAALKCLTPVYLDYIKKVKDYHSRLENSTDEEKQNEYTDKIADLCNAILALSPDNAICSNLNDELTSEREYLGAYISRHPLDAFGEPYEYSAKEISEAIGQSKATVIGMISALSIKKRRSDGAEMAFFTLSDKTGDVSTCAFSESYAKYGRKIMDGAVVKVKGQIRKEEDITKLYVSSVETLKPQTQSVVIYCKDIDDWEMQVKYIAEVQSARDGYPLKVYDLMMDEIRDTDMKVSPAILQDKRVKTVLA